jgi:hypothetical protein
MGRSSYMIVMCHVRLFFLGLWRVKAVPNKNGRMMGYAKNSFLVLSFKLNLLTINT